MDIKQPVEYQEYWNRAADRVFTTAFQLEIFAAHVGTEAVILDVGCGQGRILEQLKAAGYSHLAGTDFAPAMLDQAGRNHPELSFRPMEEGHIPWPDKSCNAVLLLAVLTCIPNNDAQKSLLAEVYRVLKPGGVLYINDFLLNDDERNQARYTVGQTANLGEYGVFQLPDGGILRHHHPHWVGLSLAAFRQLYWEEVIWPTMNGNTAKGYCYLGQKVL